MNGADGFFIIPTGGGKHPNVEWNPPWENPAKFPRSEPLGEKDDEAILRIGEIEKQLATLRKLREESIALQEQMGIVNADIEMHKARLFPMLRKNHPAVVVSNGFGYGWRKFGEQYYVVGWDEATIAKFHKEQQEKHEHGDGDDAAPGA